MICVLDEERGVNRDTFALTMSGFDTHFDLKNILNQKFTEIGASLRAFRDDLVDIGLWNNITLVVSSEMGRTITPNTSDGTDHGWGGIHFVLGGQLNGGKILGHYPDTYSSDWKYNTGEFKVQAVLCHLRSQSLSLPNANSTCK